MNAAKNGEKTFTIGDKEYNMKTTLKKKNLMRRLNMLVQFKNKNDAMAAKKMRDAVQLMSFGINDDNISGSELMVDRFKGYDQVSPRNHEEV